MKRLFCILTLCFLTGHIFAKCRAGKIEVWPKGTNLSLKGFIVIDGSGNYEDVILNLGKKFPIYLKSKNTLIPIEVQSIHKGQYGKSQAILKPTTTLNLGRVYELVIDSLPYDNTLKRNTGETVKWIITEFNDTLLPEIIIKPKLKSKTYNVYGCGPESFLTFQFKGFDNSEFLVVATVMSIKTKSVLKYYLTHDENKFTLGHDMCYGEFSFEQGKQYELTFGLIDSEGNTINWPEKIYFRGPTLIN